MENQGQGAIEYLLIIGAAILIVGIVVFSLVGVTDAGTDVALTDEQLNKMSPLEIQKEEMLGHIAISGPKSTGWVDGETYFLTQNIIVPSGTNGFTVTANDVTIDCKGRELTGISSTFGISLTSAVNTQIKNCIIKNFTFGVYVYNSVAGSSQAEITNSTLENNTYGIFTVNQPTTVLDSTLCGNTTDVRCYNMGSSLIQTNSKAKNVIKGTNCTILTPFDPCP